MSAERGNASAFHGRRVFRVDVKGWVGRPAPFSLAWFNTEAGSGQLTQADRLELPHKRSDLGALGGGECAPDER